MTFANDAWEARIVLTTEPAVGSGIGHQLVAVPVRPGG